MVPSKWTELLAAMGSSIASLMFVWAMISQYCPYEIRRYFEKLTKKFTTLFYPYVNISIHEYSGDKLKCNDAYLAVEAYLSNNTSKSAKRLKAELNKDSTKMVLSMEEHEKVSDVFDGVEVCWVLRSTIVPSLRSSMGYSYTDQQKRFYWLSFHKNNREIITEQYLDHVLKQGREIRVKNRQRKLYTNCSKKDWSSFKEREWSHVVFEHPSTFETMAMKPELKKEIVEDLLTFSRSKNYYSRIGKAWKRGYLLYGPPGTGKSSLIAAMANLLNYDVYDLELTAVWDNTLLRKLLIETTSKSILVIEDIDCSLDLTGQRNKKLPEDDEVMLKNDPLEEVRDARRINKVTLSGLLNFIDGLWSACGGERLIVFTTNYVEKLDPALIRRGRMDKYIELSYCCFEGFKVLAKNYLNLEAHPMFDTIRRLIEEVKITPADVAENLMPKSPLDNAEKCLSKLIQALEEAKAEAVRKAAEEDAKKAKSQAPAKVLGKENLTSENSSE